jgi:hypothetical protein
MKFLAALLLVLALCPAFAQSGHHAQREFQRQMPPAERRMGWEERQRLREQVHSGQMTRDEARQRWREERAKRALEPGRSPEERQRLRRDVQDASRDLEKR